MMTKKKKTTTSGEPVMVKSVHRTRSRRMKFCVHGGLRALPSTSILWQMDSHKHCLRDLSEISDKSRYQKNIFIRNRNRKP